MAETVRVVRPVGFTFVNSNHPGEVLVETAKDRGRVQSTGPECIVYARFELQAPRGMMLTKAELELTAEETWPGSRTMTARLVDASGLQFSKIRYANRPGVAAGSSNVAVTQAGTVRRWVWDVTADAAAAMGGRATWRVTSSDATKRWFKGIRDRKGWPRLVLTFEPFPRTPVNLYPAAMVSVAKPWLSWLGHPAADGVQVQFAAVDDTWSAETGFAAPVYSSGTQPPRGGEMDLATLATAWSGIPIDGALEWSVRQHLPNGWSKWAEPATVPRKAVPVPVITSPPLVEQARNLLTNPSFETNTTGWAGATGVTLSTISNGGEPNSVGATAMLLTTTAPKTAGGGTAIAWTDFITLAPGEPVAFMFHARRGTGGWPGPIYALLRFYDASNNQLAGTDVIGPAGSTVAGSPPSYNTVTVGTAAAPAGTAKVRAFIWAQNDIPSGVSCRIDRCMVWKAPTISLADYFDGDTLPPEVYAWTSTPHGSASTKSGSVTADSSPPIVWTPPAGQTWWQVLVDLVHSADGDAAYDRQDNSGVQRGADGSYAPDMGGDDPGTVYRIRVRTGDDEDRAATPGAPEYGQATRFTTFTPTAGVAGLTTLDAALVPGLPAVDVTWTRSGGTPDQVELTGAGPRVLLPGPDTPSRFWTVPPNRDLTMVGRAVVNGERSNAVQTDTVHTVVTGVWVVDPATGRGFVLSGLELEFGYGSVITTHTPESAAALIHRVSARRGLEGTMIGNITDWPGRTRSDQVDDVWWLRDRPAKPLRLILFDLNVPIVLPDVFPIFDGRTFTTRRTNQHRVHMQLSQRDNKRVS